MKSEAPWTQEQVEALAFWQNCGLVHPFTCGDCGKDLNPTPEGWFCECGYTQNWAHDFMFQRPKDPFEHIREIQSFFTNDNQPPTNTMK